MTHDPRKSDRPIVPAKSPNNAGSPAAEAMEGRGLAKGNTDQQNAHRTQRRSGAHSALDRVRQAARRDRNVKFTALFHHLTIDRLRDAFFALRRKAAAGIDGVTWAQYGVDLEANLRDLHLRLHRGVTTGLAGDHFHRHHRGPGIPDPGDQGSGPRDRGQGERARGLGWTGDHAGAQEVAVL
jgi:hypothetical protein